MDEIKIMTLNCRGLGSNEKRRDVLNYLKNMKYDIYLLQDTHLTEKKEPYFNSLWRGNAYHSFGTFNSRGTAILVNSRVQHDILYTEQCPEGNYILCVIKLHGSTFTLLNTVRMVANHLSFGTLANGYKIFHAKT